MDNRDKYIKELEEENEALKIKLTRMEIEASRKNTRGAGAKRVSDEIVNEIFDKYIKGVRVEDLATEYDLTTNTIYQKIRPLKAKNKKKSYTKEEVDKAISELIYVVDIISDATFECDSPVPKTYEELIAYYDNRVCGIDLKRIVKRASQKYDTLVKFLKEERVTFREPLERFFNIERWM